jgi:hypothetical protein
VIAEVEAVRKNRALSEKVVREAVRKWHLENPRPEDFQRWGEWGERFREKFPDYMVTTKLKDYGIHFLYEWPEFPKLHWLQIPQTVRQDKKRLRPRQGESAWRGDIFNPLSWLKWSEAKKFDTVPSFFFKTNLGLCCHTWINTFMPPGMDYWPDWKDTNKSPWGFASADRWDELRLVEMNWARSDRKLKADFAEWLKENRPDDRQPFHKSQESESRRTTERDLLKALGALRLLHHFKGDWKAAATYSERFCEDKRGNPKPLYAEQSEWRDAEKRAKEALREFSQKVFG